MKNKIYGYNLSCWGCHDSVHVLLLKLLGYNCDDIIEPKRYSDFEDIFPLIEEGNYILKLELIFGKNAPTHSLLIVGKYVMQSYYMTYPFRVEEITILFLQGLKHRDWAIITGTNHDLTDKPRLTCIDNTVLSIKLFIFCKNVIWFFGRMF
jgi:hypothetical protein